MTTTETALATTQVPPPITITSAIERALVMGELNSMNAEQRVNFYNAVCQSLRLNPLTRPLEYIILNSKLTLYARKDCTEQLRRRDSVAVKILSREVVEDCYVVTSGACTPDGRTDESIGVVPIAGLKGEAKANAMMKAETKSKRRVTLSICGLGILDETEVEPRAARKGSYHFESAAEPQAQLEAGNPEAEELPADPAEPSDEPARISEDEAKSFAKAFDAALPKQCKAVGKTLLEAWLKKQGLSGLLAIAKDDLGPTQDEALAYAKQCV